MDLLTSQIQTAQTVVGQLGRCIEGERQLVEYLTAPAAPADDTDTPEGPTPEQIQDFSSSVDELCTSAINANRSFQESLAQ